MAMVAVIPRLFVNLRVEVKAFALHNSWRQLHFMIMNDVPAAIAFQQAARRTMERCDELAACTERSGEITRTFCSAAMRDAYAKLRGWMEVTGMNCRLDAATNLIGRFNPPPPSASAKGEGATHTRVVLIGSHLDSVVNAGRYDGPLGVLMGLALVELLSERRQQLPFAIDVIAFCEEEGVRYQTPYIGSRALVGELNDELLSRRDAVGISMREAVRAFGGDPDQLANARYQSDQVIAYLEPHIEQGPVLELENLPVGIVTGIAGQTRASLQFVGRAGHAGTTPMAARQDALTAAAEFVLAVERLGRSHTGLVATVGQLKVCPNVGNVIPGSVQLRIDLRHIDDALREATFKDLLDQAHSLAGKRQLQFKLDWVQHQSAVACDSKCTDLLESSALETGIRSNRLASGAGHDAAVVARHFPTAMLFLRCAGGVSHHPDESLCEADVAAGLEVMWRFVSKLA
jgi:allantoate deiminase